MEGPSYQSLPNAASSCENSMGWKRKWKSTLSTKLKALVSQSARWLNHMCANTQSDSKGRQQKKILGISMLLVILTQLSLQLQPHSKPNAQVFLEIRHEEVQKFDEKKKSDTKVSLIHIFNQIFSFSAPPPQHACTALWMTQPCTCTGAQQPTHKICSAECVITSHCCLLCSS